MYSNQSHSGFRLVTFQMQLDVFVAFRPHSGLNFFHCMQIGLVSFYPHLFCLFFYPESQKSTRVGLDRHERLFSVCKKRLLCLVVLVHLRVIRDLLFGVLGESVVLLAHTLLFQTSTRSIRYPVQCLISE